MSKYNSLKLTRINSYRDCDECSWKMISLKNENRKYKFLRSKWIERNFEKNTFAYCMKIYINICIFIVNLIFSLSLLFHVYSSQVTDRTSSIVLQYIECPFIIDSYSVTLSLAYIVLGWPKWNRWFLKVKTFFHFLEWTLINKIFSILLDNLLHHFFKFIIPRSYKFYTLSAKKWKLLTPFVCKFSGFFSVNPIFLLFTLYIIQTI